MTPSTPMPAAVRRRLVPAAGIVAVEGLAMLALAAADVTDLTGDRLGLGIGVAVFLAAYGLAQVGGAVMLLRGRSGPRGGLVLTQLIQLGLAWNLRDAEYGDRSLPWVAWLLAGTAVIALACLLSPVVNRHFEPVGDDDDGGAPGEDRRPV